MDIDIRIASKGIIETLRERIAELEDLEASGASTPPHIRGHHSSRTVMRARRHCLAETERTAPAHSLDVETRGRCMILASRAA